MPFCKNCGASVSGQFCQQCGTPLAAAPGGGYTPPAGAPQPQPAGQPYVAAPQAAPAAAGLTDNVAALLCYVAPLICGIVFLVLQPYNQKKFIRFHAFQSIFFGLSWFAIWIVYDIVIGSLIRSWSWGLLGLLSTIGTLIWLAFLVIWVILLVKAYQGQQFKLPVIGDLAEKQA